jgi:hypothetical protein
LTGTSTSPLFRLDRKVPHEREPLSWGDSTPELEVEGTVVLVQIDEPGRSLASLFAPVHSLLYLRHRRLEIVVIPDFVEEMKARLAARRAQP